MTWLTIFATALVTGSMGLHGSLEGVVDGAELRLVLNDDTLCTGHLTEFVEGVGRGVLVCADGSRGTFRYQRQQDGSGVATGRLGLEPLSLYFD